MNRRHFIQLSGLSLAAILTSDSVLAAGASAPLGLINYPDSVTALVGDQSVKLLKAGNGAWKYKELLVMVKEGTQGLELLVQAPGVSLSAVTLHWKYALPAHSTILGDHWERTYGDVGWHQPTSAEWIPWYFLQYDGKSTHGFGVKTGARTFCAWQLDPGELSLQVDTHNGGSGVQLGARTLQAATIITRKGKPGESPYQAARAFMGELCSGPRLPRQPVYGINDWYFTYGNNSADLILEHTRLLMPMAAGLDNKPFSVIDAGWFEMPPGVTNDSSWGDNMYTPNAKFGDMARLASRISEIGMRPGLWTRPLCGSHKDAPSLILPAIKGRENAANPVMDPSLEENLQKVKDSFRIYKQWGYELVKFDYTSYDIFGRWGIEMLQAGSMTAGGWRMQDNTRTNAEIVLALYNAIRQAAGDTYIISCNTFSHLSAGLFELNRIGDDTSGEDWARTRKMGVNTLAFRGIQQGKFYAADGDCVGMTSKVPWEKNRQWLQLLAGSGMPLFISAQPQATGTEQKQAVKEAFRQASRPQTPGEPLDWLENSLPSKWKLQGQVRVFNWD